MPRKFVSIVTVVFHDNGEISTQAKAEFDQSVVNVGGGLTAADVGRAMAAVQKAVTRTHEEAAGMGRPNSLEQEYLTAYEAAMAEDGEDYDASQDPDPR